MAVISTGLTSYRARRPGSRSVWRGLERSSGRRSHLGSTAAECQAIAANDRQPALLRDKLTMMFLRRQTNALIEATRDKNRRILSVRSLY